MVRVLVVEDDARLNQIVCASLRAVDVYITRIRDKMSVSDDFKITTVHGLDYKAVPGA